MYPKNDNRYLWVGPLDESRGTGTFDKPYGRLGDALSKARPGNVIVLKKGTYCGDATIQVSGDIDNPLRIVAAPDSEVVVSKGCWYFYDVSDLILSGLIFRDSPLGSIAVMGACTRNRFERLRFENCGHASSASCTLFFGGSGGSCNIVESCDFAHSPDRNSVRKDPSAMTVGLMISEGDAHEDKAITNHIIRKNRFSNYDYGVLVGTQDVATGLYGHLISYNSIDNCKLEGVMVKCGDTEVRGNLVTRCPGHSISVVTGEGSVVQDNRIADCGVGIRVAGRGHTVSNNCIIRSAAESIFVMGKNGHDGIATQNVIVENNTCAGWSKKEDGYSHPGIGIEAGTASIIQRNLFFGSGEPYRIFNQQNGSKTYLVRDNAWAGQGKALDGVSAIEIEIPAADSDDFGTASSYGAAGWVCRPGTFDPDSEAVEESACPENDLPEIADEMSVSHDHEFSGDSLMQRSLFFADREQFESEPSNRLWDDDSAI